MTKAVVERDGVLLEVEFQDPQHVDGPHIQSVRVLDAEYRATGPDLTPMFNNLFFLTSEEEGERFLTSVASEIS